VAREATPGTAEGSLPRGCDVAVVGAGIVGTSVAARLAAAGVEVCVLEVEGPAAGASSAGEGNLLLSDKLPGAELALAQRSLELWGELPEEAKAQVELEVKGGLVVAWGERELAELEGLVAAQRRQGVRAELLPGEALGDLEPALSRELAGGAYYPEDVQVQPMLAVARQLGELSQGGGRLVPDARVTGARHGPGGEVTALTTARGTIEVGRWVVNAAGAWAGELAQLLGGSVPVEPRKGHVLVTERLGPFLRHKVYEAGYLGSVHSAGAFECAAVVESTPAGTLLLGSSREFAGFSGKVDYEVVAAIAARALRLVPGLAATRLLRAYTGFRPATPDRLPVIGPDLQVPNLLHATGHEGAGILLSQVTGEIVTCLVLGREPPVDLAPFSAGRFGAGLVHPATPSHRQKSHPSLARQAEVGRPRLPCTPEQVTARAELVRFSFDGRTLAAPSGATVAGGLIWNGERAWRLSRSGGQRRGLFCGIGTCFDCLVDLDGEKAVRACLAPLREGAVVETSRACGRLGTSSFRRGATMAADVAVVGAGPAGMAAASAAASRGARVVLVDSYPRLGGQFFRQPLSDGLGRPGAPAGPKLPERWHSLASHPLVELVLGADVWSASREEEGFLVRFGSASLRSRALVLATGASELALPFPGWDLPGVMTAGAAQALWKSQRLAAGARVVVGGTGPFLLPVAAALAEAGARVTVIEAAPARAHLGVLAALLAHPGKFLEAAGYAAALAGRPVRFLTGRAVVRCEGAGAVERAITSRLGPGWEPLPGTARALEADAVCISYGFVPRLELARQLGESSRGLFLAGEVAGVAGAEVAELEGELAGRSAASYLGLAGPAGDERLERHLRAARTFADRLLARYPVRPGWASWAGTGTVFCRCEDVAWGEVEAAVAGGARTVREVRNLTRCGMGYCQGRTCGPALELAVAALARRPRGEVGDLHKRPVAVPVPLGAV
jgi:glycine/D-amino acid oxidase-like deaminating enzyme